MLNLSGKVAIITGAGSGIGESIALHMSQQGARCHLLDLQLAMAQRVSETIQAAGGQAKAYQADVSKQSELKVIMEEIANEYGQIDILVNNAGIAHIGTVETTSEEDMDRVYAVNVKGVYNCMHVAIPYMKKKGGSIINMASIVSSVGIPERFAYSMSKGAVLTMTYSAAKDCLSYNLRVNCISPARVHTPFVDGYLAQNYPGQEEEMYQQLAKTQPIGRMGKPSEIAALAVYLASDEASFITGTNFPIDGGFVTLNN